MHGTQKYLVSTSRRSKTELSTERAGAGSNSGRKAEELTRKPVDSFS